MAKLPDHSPFNLLVNSSTNIITANIHRLADIEKELVRTGELAKKI